MANPTSPLQSSDRLQSLQALLAATAADLERLCGVLACHMLAGVRPEELTPLLDRAVATAFTVQQLRSLRALEEQCHRGEPLGEAVSALLTARSSSRPRTLPKEGSTE